MEAITKTKFVHNQKVFIRTGYYRGYKAVIQDYRSVSVPIEDLGTTKTVIEYKLKIEGIVLKEEYWIAEEYIMKWNRYIIF